MKSIESFFVYSMCFLCAPLYAAAATNDMAKTTNTKTQIAGSTNTAMALGKTSQSLPKSSLHPAVSKRNDLRRDAKGYYYIVKKDDFLGYIATRFYGTKKATKKIMLWNNIKNPNHIWAGRKLRFKEPPVNLDENLGRQELLRALGKRFGLSKNWFDNYYKKPFVNVPKNTSQENSGSKETKNKLENVQNKSIHASQVADSADSRNSEMPGLDVNADLPGTWKLIFSKSDGKTLLAIGDRLFGKDKIEEGFWFLHFARTQDPNLGKA